MLLFHNDYNEVCHPAVLERMLSLKQEQMPGYGEDPCCDSAAAKIRKLCENTALREQLCDCLKHLPKGNETELKRYIEIMF